MRYLSPDETKAGTSSQHICVAIILVERITFYHDKVQVLLVADTSAYNNETVMRKEHDEIEQTRAILRRVHAASRPWDSVATLLETSIQVRRSRRPASGCAQPAYTGTRMFLNEFAWT